VIEGGRVDAEEAVSRRLEGHRQRQGTEEVEVFWVQQGSVQRPGGLGERLARRGAPEVDGVRQRVIVIPPHRESRVATHEIHDLPGMRPVRDEIAAHEQPVERLSRHHGFERRPVGVKVGDDQDPHPQMTSSVVTG